MDFKDLKNKSQAELKDLLLDNTAELHSLKLKAHNKQLKQFHKISQVRKIVAQLMTLLKKTK